MPKTHVGATEEETVAVHHQFRIGAVFRGPSVH